MRSSSGSKSQPDLRSYSPDDLKRLRAAATIIVGVAGETPAERFMLIEERMRKAVADGESVDAFERKADKVALEEGRELQHEIELGEAAIWQDPGYLRWIKERGLTLEGVHERS